MSEAPADLGREYVPRVCCWHDWRPEMTFDATTGEGSVSNSEVCANCGAACKRDPKTRAIVDYETVASRGIQLELRARRREARRERMQ